jgi:hypothetical protein
MSRVPHLSQTPNFTAGLILNILIKMINKPENYLG